LIGVICDSWLEWFVFYEINKIIAIEISKYGNNGAKEYSDESEFVL
jgi:hypothetical protein